MNSAEPDFDGMTQISERVAEDWSHCVVRAPTLPNFSALFSFYTT